MSARKTVRCVLWLVFLVSPAALAQIGPAAHWKFDEASGGTTVDASGSGSTGTLVASPTWSTGRINSALTFSGVRYVTANAPANLANLYTTGMTVTVWIKPVTAGTGNGGRIVDKSNGGAGWSLKMNGATKVQFAASEFATTDATRDSGTAIVLNTWQHVAVTWTGSATATNINLYINGILSNGTAVNGVGALRDDTATPIAIGNRPVDAARGFDGGIDDVRVYQRVLTAAEIQVLADSSAPGAPGSPAANSTSGTQINLSWTAATDNVAVTEYLIERCTGASCSNFAQVGTATGLSYNNTGLTAATAYRYRIRATDANTNLGAYSGIVSATTSSGGDTQVPTTPTGLGATAVSSTQVNLSWTAATDNVGVTGYQLQRCTGASCTSWADVSPAPSGTSTTYNNTGLSPLTTYRYQVRARDAAGNWSAYSTIASATTPAAPDTTPPSQPTMSAPTVVSSTQINLSWTAATDNVGVTGYQLQRCTGSSCTSWADVSPAPSGIGTTYNNTGLSPSTTYRYQVRARDAAGNWGAYSNIVSATTTTASDTTPPSVPGSFSVTVQPIQTVLAWNASTDNIGVAGYEVRRCLGASCVYFTTSSLTYTDATVVAGSTYAYSVRARDAANNYSAYTTAINIIASACD